MKTLVLCARVPSCPTQYKDICQTTRSRSKLSLLCNNCNSDIPPRAPSHALSTSGSEQSALRKYQRHLLFNTALQGPSITVFCCSESLGAFPPSPSARPMASSSPWPQRTRPGAAPLAQPRPQQRQGRGRGTRGKGVGESRSWRSGINASRLLAPPSPPTPSAAYLALAQPSNRLLQGSGDRGTLRTLRRKPRGPPTPSTHPKHEHPEPADIRGHLRPRPHDSSTISFRHFRPAEPPGRRWAFSARPCYLHAHPEQALGYLLRSIRRFHTKPP